MTVEINREKILCIVALDDDIGELIDPRASDTYWRGFIVQNRDTGDISAKMRFKFKNGERDWWNITLSPENQRKSTAERVTHLQEGLERFIRARVAQVHPLHEEPLKFAVTCNYPPDDEGDVSATMRWLEQMDLVHPGRPATPEEEAEIQKRSDPAQP